MTTKLNHLALAAVLALALPAASQAATVINANLTADGFFTFNETLSTDDDIEFKFTVLEDLKVAEFAVSGTGSSSTNDLNDVTFGFVSPTSEIFASFADFNTVSAGFSFLPGATFAAGDMFSFFFEEGPGGLDNPVSVTLSFNTAAVPLPATALLLAPLLLTGAAVGRRKAKRKASV